MKKRIRRLLWITGGSILLALQGKAQQSQTDDVLNLLVKKGEMTQEEADSLRADWAIKEQQKKEKQTKYNLSLGKALQLAGFVQGRYQILDEPGKIDGFDIRRARLDFKGAITQKWDYRLLLDFAGAPKILDATASYTLADYLKFTAGEFKVPFSLENVAYDDSRLLTIERSQVVEALVARGKDVIGNHNGRDIGAQLSGSFIKVDDNYLFDYSFGVFNGAGLNTSDNNENKDIVGRFTFHPVKEIDLSGNIYDGVGHYAATATSPVADHGRTRWGVDARYVKNDFSLSAEYIRGKDAAIRKEGWYGQAAYFILPKRLQLVARYDTFDPNLSNASDTGKWYVFGANIFFNTWAKLQVNETLKRESGAQIHNDLFGAQLTLSF